MSLNFMRQGNTTMACGIGVMVDHVPYHRQEAINARSGVHTPRSTLASWPGRGRAALEPLLAAQKRFVLSSRVLHDDEMPVPMPDPGAGKTKRAYVWAYARGAFDAMPGVVCDFCLGEGRSTPPRSSARMMIRPVGEVGAARR